MTDDFDPLATETFASAHEDYARLRRHCPVAHSSAFNGFWMPTRYADVAAILRDSGTFITSVQNVVPRVAFTGRRPPLHLDPPEHTPYRRVLNRFFTGAKVAALEPDIRRITIELLEPLIAAGRFDFCRDFTHPFPGRVFARFFNLAEEVGMQIREVTEGYDMALQETNDELVKEASLKLYAIARELIEARKENPLDPADDPTSALLAATHDGQKLPEDMVLGTVRQFIVVGMIAPIVFLGSCVVHLSEHPELQDQLRSQPSLIPAAVQEFLRLFTPYRGFARTANRDVTLGDRQIRKDEPIALNYASANRDDSVFPNGDQFVLGRPNISRHLAFGGGPHRCAGAPLAVVMFRIVFEELLSRTGSIELDGPIRMSGWPEIGTLSVPIRVSPA